MTDETTDFDGLRAQIEEQQAQVDMWRAELKAIESAHDPETIEAAGLDGDLSGLRADLREWEEELEELRESLAATEMFDEALHEAKQDADPRGYR